MAAKQGVRILHLEDNPDDAGLIQQALKNDGLTCDIRVITSSFNYLKALEAGDHDLVLSDSGVPGIDALGALQLALQHNPEVPFVFVTGRFESQSTIDRLKAAGAAECLNKSDLQSVARAVRSILEPDRPLP